MSDLIIEQYSVTDAAQDIEGLLSAWRQRVGVWNDSINDVTGTSITWKDNGTEWTFTFSVRRGSKWSKMSQTIQLPSDEVESGLDTDSPTRFDLVVMASEALLNQMMLDVFSDTKDALLGKPCKKHPTYKAVRKPRTDCEDCWQLYKDRHPGE